MNASGYPALYANPLVKSGTYLAKVSRVVATKRADGTTTLTAELVLDHHGPEIDGTKLVAILHATEKGKKVFYAFLNAYRVTEQTVQQAVGRYAAVYVYETEYKGSFYSAVRFSLQTFAVQEKVAEIEAQEAKATGAKPQPGTIPWLDEEAA